MFPMMAYRVSESRRLFDVFRNRFGTFRGGEVGEVVTRLCGYSGSDESKLS